MYKKSLENSLQNILYLPFAAFLLYFAYYAPQYGVWFGSGAALGLLLLVALLVLPIGRMRFGHVSQSLVTWFIKVVCFELIFILVFLAGVVAVYGAGPFFAQETIELAALKQAMVDYRWLVWSFFPWGLTILWVVIMGYYYYVRAVGPYPHQVGCEVFDKVMPERTKSFTETTIHAANTMIIAMLTSTVILLLTYSVQVYFELVPHMLLVPISFTILGFFTLFMIYFFRRSRLRHYDKRGYHLGFLFNIVILVVCIALVVSSFMSAMFLKATGITLEQLQCSSCAGYFSTTLPSNRMAAYFWGWGVAIVPLCGSVFIKLSQGRSVREIVIGLSVLPAALYILFYIYADGSIELMQTLGLFAKDVSVTYKIGLMLGLAFVCYGLLMLFIKGQHTSHVLHAGVLEQGATPAGRMLLTQGPKIIGLSKMFMPLVIAIITTIIMHMVGGWYLIQVNLVIFALVCMYHLYGAMIVTLVHFGRQKLWFKPENAGPLL